MSSGRCGLVAPRGGKSAHRHLHPQIPPGKRQSRNPNQHVIPSQDEFLPPHQPRRDEDAQAPSPSATPSSGTKPAPRAGGNAYPRLQRIMQSVGSPTQLPGAKILVPALLVKVGEQQEQQQRDEPRQDDSVDGQVLSIFLGTVLRRSPQSFLIRNLRTQCFHTILDKTIVFR